MLSLPHTQCHYRVAGGLCSAPSPPKNQIGSVRLCSMTQEMQISHAPATGLGEGLELGSFGKAGPIATPTSKETAVLHPTTFLPQEMWSLCM